MKKLALFCLCMLAMLRLSAASGDSQEVTLFNIGWPLAGTKMNFDNLFDNFPKYIANADKIELKYYSYVGVCKTERQIRKYIRKNFPSHVPSWGVYRCNGGDTVNGKYSVIRFTIEDSPFSVNKELQKRIENELVDEYIHLGDEVWEIVFELWDKEYHYYMFASPATNQVVTHGNLFGVSLHSKASDACRDLCKKDLIY